MQIRLLRISAAIQRITGSENHGKDIDLGMETNIKAFILASVIAAILFSSGCYDIRGLTGSRL